MVARRLQTFHGYSLTQMFLIVSAYELTRAELENWREAGGRQRRPRRRNLQRERRAAAVRSMVIVDGWVDGWMEDAPDVVAASFDA